MLHVSLIFDFTRMIKKKKNAVPIFEVLYTPNEMTNPCLIIAHVICRMVYTKIYTSVK